MAHPSNRLPRGMTLLELVVAMTITAVVMAGISSVVIAQQRAYTEGNKVREAQSAGRTAILEIEKRLMMAGYGMDAPLAFDFDRYKGPCPAQLSPCPRDATANSDEIVFFHRNPAYWVPDVPGGEPRGYAWAIPNGGVTANAVTVIARGGEVFPKGQILQAVCEDGGYLYMTVDRTTGELDPGPQSVPLVAAESTDPFRRQDLAATPPLDCVNSGTARLFLIERQRLHVRPVATDAGFEPFLVLDTGTDVDGNGTVDEADEIILAEGVEILQFAYVLTNATLAPRGSIPGTAISYAPGAVGSNATTSTGFTTLLFPGTVEAGKSAYEPTSWYDYAVGPPPHANRLTDHQANIRAVRVALSARATFPDPNRAAPPFDPAAAGLLNMNALPSWIPANDGFQRFTMTTTVPLRNMVSRAMTYY